MVTLRYRKVRLTDDGHEGVEVANVEALPGNIDEELYHRGPLLLLCWLQKQIQFFSLVYMYRCKQLIRAATSSGLVN